MGPVKKHLFSCAYSFNPVGVDEFIDRFKHGLDDPNTAPFVSYDPKDNLFSLTVDVEDHEIAAYFLAQLKYFTTQHAHSPQALDPRIRRLDGFHSRKTLDQGFNQDPNLLDIFDDESDSGDEDALQAMQHLTEYWRPVGGDIKILTTAAAEQIASLTGCSIYPEPAERRVRLVNGDFKLALAKLQNMEPLLALQHQQRAFSTTRANANILLHTPEQPNPSMRFWPIADPFHLPFKRIMVDEQATRFLDQKFVCETFIIDDDELRSHPANLVLEGVPKTTKTEPFSIWNNFVYKRIGDEQNILPKVASNPNAAGQSELSPPVSRVGSNLYIEPSKAARVAAWTGQIDETADPNLAKPEIPTEPTTARRRVVAADSDSEDDQDRKLVQKATATIASTLKPTDKEILTVLTPRTAKRQTNDLISFGSTTPSIALQPVTQTPEVVSGLSVFQDGALRCDLLDSSTVTSNLLLDKASETQPPAYSSCLAAPWNQGDADRPPPVTDPRSMLRDTLTVGLPEFQSCAEHAAENVDGLAGSQAAQASKERVIQSSASATLTQFLSDTPSSGDGSSSGDGWQAVAPPKRSAIKALDGAYSEGASNSSPAIASSYGRVPQQVNGSTSESNGPPQAFDPAAYSLKSRDSHSGPNTSNIMSPPTSAALCSRESICGSSLNAQRGARFRGRGGRPSNNEERFVDMAPEVVTARSPLMSPPGLDTQTPRAPNKVEEAQPLRSPKIPNIIDEPFVNPVLPHYASRDNSDLMSFSAAPRSSVSKGPPSFVSQAAYDQWASSKDYENHVVYKPNVKALKNSRLEELVGMQMATKAGKKVTSSNAVSSQRKVDKHSVRGSFHSTMSQKAGNPGKKKGGKAKAEAAEQARRRKQKALEEAYGGPVVSQKPTLNQLHQDISEMSKAKQKLLGTNKNMASSNSQALAQSAQQKATESLLTALTPLFEAGRAFSGEIQFEIQLGQAMVTSDGGITKDKAVSSRTWEKLLGLSAKPNGPMSSFTRMLTTNGADIDRALEIKAPNSSFKIWDKSQSGKSKLTYEFHCQSKQGIDFWLIVDEDGNYHIRNGTTIVGFVAIHAPAQIWDAAAVLQGQENWDNPPRAIVDAVADFVDSIYVMPRRHQLCLIFRQPTSLEITIRNVVMKRISLHQCQLIDHHDMQLQATEVKILYSKTHPGDRRLWQAFEKDYPSMQRDGTVHYELSILDRSVNQVLARNKDLEVGELTPATTTGKSLLRKEPIGMMLDLTAHMLNKIDWLGGCNFGTLVRRDQKAQEQILRQQQILPPTARSRTHQPVLPASKTASRYGGSMMNGSAGGDTFVGMTRIQGTRAGTMAEVFDDGHGNLYAKGLGGAHVPIASPLLLGELETIGEEVLPDDSASQYGIPKGRSPNARRRSTRGKSHDDRGRGFW